MIETIDELSERAAEFARGIAEEKGELSLLALFQPEGALPDLWDLLVAAPWLEDDHWEDLKYLEKELKRAFNKEDILRLSRIVILKESYPIRQAIRRIAQTEGEPIVLYNRRIGHLQIEQAIFLISR